MEWVKIEIPKSRIPDGARLIEAYETPEYIVIMFSDGEEIPDYHSCDQMGCGSFSHVKHYLWKPKQ